MHNVRVVSCVIWGLMRAIAWETASQMALRNCSEGVWGGQYIYDFSEQGIRAVKHTVWRKVSASHEEQTSPLMILVLV